MFHLGFRRATRSLSACLVASALFAQAPTRKERNKPRVSSSRLTRASAWRCWIGAEPAVRWSCWPVPETRRTYSTDLPKGWYRWRMYMA